MTCLFGCRNLEWRCKDCNRVASTATIIGAWKKVEDEMPESGARVLAVNMDDEKPYVDTLVYLGIYKDMHEWSSYICNTFDPTHWMPYPELPKGKL